MILTLFVVLADSGQVLASDNSRIAWNNSEWGNTDWVHTDWGNTDWGHTDWGNTDWGNTGWENSAQNPQVEKPKEQLTKVTLGIKNPDGSCIMVVTWAKSSGEAIDAVAKNCQGCIINELVNSDSPGAEVENAGRYCQ